MSRAKKHEHVNHERWLVSYADFITLLFAFFVVLFASSQSDRKKQKEVAAAMQTAFTPLGSFEAHAKTPPIEQAPSASTITRPAALALPFPQAGQTTREEEMKERLSRLLLQAGGRLPEGSVTTRITPDGLVISLHEIGFFPSGAAEVRRESIPMLVALAETIPRCSTACGRTYRTMCRSTQRSFFKLGAFNRPSQRDCKAVARVRGRFTRKTFRPPDMLSTILLLPMRLRRDAV